MSDIHYLHEDELTALLRWKAEALPLLETLDRCHDLLPKHAQAQLGQSKAAAVERYIAEMNRMTW